MNKVPQTGLINKVPQPGNWVASGINGIPFEERLSGGVWEEFLSKDEKQYTIGFDTMSCVTFSATNIIEAHCNWLLKNKKISEDAVKHLTNLGYIENGKFEFSDRFTAIMSGTTKFGNDFVSVWECIRTVGLIPEKDFPFAGNSWEEYHDKTKITDQMIAKAKDFLNYFLINYQWVFWSYDLNLNSWEVTSIKRNIQQSPLQIAIPQPAVHAITMTAFEEKKKYRVFDHYPPYKSDRDLSYPIHYSMMGYVTVKDYRPLSYTFTKDLEYGMRDEEIIFLQKALNSDSETRVAFKGAGSPGMETNFFGDLTRYAVIRFQKKYGISPVGRVGINTRAKLNELYNIKNTPPGGRIKDWALAIQIHEGFYAPGEHKMYPRGTRSWRNKNPGNIRYIGQKRAIGKDEDNFCIFATYEDGLAELCDMLTRAATPPAEGYSPEMTLLEFFKRYAPSSDGNSPANYAAEVAKRLKVAVDLKIKELV